MGKEAVAGLIVALEEYLAKDHDAERREWERRAKRIMEQLLGIPNVKAKVLPPGVMGGVPRLSITLDEGGLGRTKASVVEALREGEPSIRVGAGSVPGLITIDVSTLHESEDYLLILRMREILAGWVRARSPLLLGDNPIRSPCQFLV